MRCSRCSLNLPRHSLICPRCGQAGPRALSRELRTDPPGEGPRAVPAVLGRPLSVDSSPGLRVVDLPAPPRPAVCAVPAWSREAENHLPLGAPQAVVSGGLSPVRGGSAPAAGATALRPDPLPSVVHEARTIPAWHDVPRADAPRPVTLPPMAVAVDPPAPVLARLLAGAVDVALVLLVTALSVLLGLLAYGDATGSLWDRGLDAVVDGLLTGQGLGWVVLALAAVISMVYTTTCHMLAGATLGKALLRIRLVDVDGGIPGLGDALMRSIGSVISVLLVGGGYLMALLDRDRLALHDRLVGTRLVTVPAPVDEDEADEPVDSDEDEEVSGHGSADIRRR